MAYSTDYVFPDPETSDGQGLLAMGGGLEPERILQAYSQGVFPWFEPGCPVLWWSPNPRLILIPNEFVVSKSLKKSLKKPLRWSIDTAFSEVMRACATCAGRTGNTWISEDMISAYSSLHQMGYAHSFEVWDDHTLVGGLYGISLGNAFFGESMFQTLTDASKIAMYYLCQTLTLWDFDFIDCQIPSNHLISLGAKVICRQEFIHHLRQTLRHPDRTGVWSTAEISSLFLENDE